MNELNRLLIVLVSGVIIVLMGVAIFLTWAVPDDVILELGEFVEFLDDNDTLAGQLIVTLGALAIGVLALLMIIVELAPEDEPKELRVEQAGATTLIPADALRLRLEEALLALPDVTAARSRVNTRDGGIATSLELTVTPNANLAEVTQASTRVVVDTIQTELGLQVTGAPSVKFAFGGSKASAARVDDASVSPPLQPSPSVLAPIDPQPGSGAPPEPSDGSPGQPPDGEPGQAEHSDDTRSDAPPG